jgi:hypothetical protein
MRAAGTPRGLIATCNRPCLPRTAVLACCSVKGPCQARPLHGPVLPGIYVGTLFSNPPVVVPLHGQGGSRDPPQGFLSPPKRLAPTHGATSGIPSLGGPCQAPSFPTHHHHRSTPHCSPHEAKTPSGRSAPQCPQEPFRTCRMCCVLRTTPSGRSAPKCSPDSLRSPHCRTCFHLPP